MSPTPACHRRGAVMIVVLGLITIMLGLALGLTVRVYAGVKGGAVVQQNAQAWIMMRAAAAYLDRQPPGPGTDYAFTIGDLLPGDLADKDLDDRQGWARIRQFSSAGEVYLDACGGSSGSGGKDAITDGGGVRNAMDVRYLYHRAADGRLTLLPVQNDHYADKW